MSFAIGMILAFLGIVGLYLVTCYMFFGGFRWLYIPIYVLVFLMTYMGKWLFNWSSEW